MCGRATLTSPSDDIAELFEAHAIDIGPPRFNIAPGQALLTVRRASARARELALLKWGLVPWWAKPEEVKRLGGSCIQARAESVATAPAFRDAFADHRCLVVIDGFYEWRTLPDGRRVPHHVRASSKKPFAVAGLWDRWKTPEGEVLETCAVVTTAAEGVIRTLHDRMPLVVANDAWNAWLEGSAEEAKSILSSKKPSADFTVVPVSSWVNDVRHDDPRCLEALASVNDAKGQIGFSFLAEK